MLSKHLETSCKTEAESVNQQIIPFSVLLLKKKTVFILKLNLNTVILCLSCLSHSVGLDNLETSHFGVLHMLRNAVYRGLLQFVAAPFLLLSPRCTANTHLMHFYPGFIQQFSLSKLLHTDSPGRGSKRLAPRSKPVRPRERDRKRKREKGNLNWSLVNLQTFFPGRLHALIKSTPLAQTLVATRGGGPLMPLPWLPRWPNPPASHPLTPD